MNPCLECGACCVVSAIPSWVNAPLEQPTQDGRTTGITRDLRCTQLCGTVGKAVRCNVYEVRPTICMQFPIGGAECQEARRLAGLPPLVLDYSEVRV